MRLVRARALLVGPGATRAERIHAPAASLASHSLRCGGRRPATVSPQAQNGSCGPLFRRSLGLAPCPHPMRCSSGGCTLSLLGAQRFASLSTAASASPLRRLPPSSRVLRALRSSGRHLAAASALRALARRCPASAPRAGAPCASLRSLTLGRALRPSSIASGPLRGRRSPAALAGRRLRRLYCGSLRSPPRNLHSASSNTQRIVFILY